MNVRRVSWVSMAFLLSFPLCFSSHAHAALIPVNVPSVAPSSESGVPLMQRCQAIETEKHPKWLDNQPNDLIVSAQFHPPSKRITTSHCLVSGVMSKRLGPNGERYETRFELRLPSRWQSRFAYQFNDSLYQANPAFGTVTGMRASEYAINQGFAVVSSNSGLPIQPSSHPLLLDPQARKDLAYAAVQGVNPVARQLTEYFYQSPIKFAYGMGQADGGRVAMVAATRFPTMFDGLLVGYPGLNAPKAALQHPWDVQMLSRVSNDIRQSLSARDLDFFAHQLLARCDGLDGAYDDMIFAIDACQNVFNPNALVCKSDFDRDCLALEKVGALARMHRGPHNNKNQALYTDWLFDAGIRSDHWRQWRVNSTVSAWDGKPMSVALGATALAQLYSTPPIAVKPDIYALESYLQAFDFDRDAPAISATTEYFTDSAMTLMTPPNVAKPTLTAFKQQGGKMLVFHGNSDPVFSVKDTMRWYDFLDFALEGRAHELVRFYRIPGMVHGQGGPAADQFNLLSPLMAWVEQQKAPQSIVAATRSDNPDVTDSMKGITRPLCPYPSYARYRSGNPREASSFQCVRVAE
ncbi:tannase/feruloyl esterase family alpha/beta hydrolase [Marinomonas algarum]|uniref:Tannase/feruloyl esterase family alpha/beta hydrolase n=1 Tax=Marinomonas algarum TaxID=2883105 RepID=A0A9X1ING4_9GAMM|nr:tannase/feruloyl esterase family alpha/beta hydrolase [Marinomonas algarum]MCB5162365.1 tannase/feruloyl esterase family alpha/beta hydrolase [Marinomonas algarum]